MSSSEGKVLGYVDCTPRISPEQYLNILDMNMDCLRKEFGPGWTKTKKIGGVYADDQLHRAVDARHAFIKRWYELLEADLYLLDYIARVRGYDRHHLPGVVTSISITPPGKTWSISILMRGKPLQAIPRDELKAEVMRLFMSEENYPIEEIKKNIEYYLRGQGYETLDIEETVTIEV